MNCYMTEYDEGQVWSITVSFCLLEIYDRVQWGAGMVYNRVILSFVYWRSMTECTMRCMCWRSISDNLQLWRWHLIVWKLWGIWVFIRLLEWTDWLWGTSSTSCAHWWDSACGFWEEKHIYVYSSALTVVL